MNGLSLMLSALLAFAPGASAEGPWDLVPAPEANVLLDVAEAALEHHWDRTGRGRVKARYLYNGYDVEFDHWWQQDWVGVDVTRVTENAPDPEVAFRATVFRAIYSPQEQWIYTPSAGVCNATVQA